MLVRGRYVVDEITGSRTSFRSANWQDKRYGMVNETKSYTDMNVRVMWTVIMQISKDVEPIQRLKSHR